MNIKRKNRYDHSFIYDSEEIDTKIKETGSILGKFLNYSYENVLDYYKAVSDNLNEIQDNKEENFVFMDRNNLESWNRLKYSELMDKHYGVHIIHNKNLNCSFFVSSTIDILINNDWLEGKSIESINLEELNEFYKNHKYEFIFTFNEIKYLKGYESKHRVHIIKNNHVDGKQLIECYEKCTNKLKKDFGTKKIIQKEFSSILYKFIFQVTGNDFNDLIETQELKKLGYFYVIPEEKIGDSEGHIYSMKNGFNFDFMKKENDSVGIL
jgi:CRISPR-associated endonuclease/helicase Cas3